MNQKGNITSMYTVTTWNARGGEPQELSKGNKLYTVDILMFLEAKQQKSWK